MKPLTNMPVALLDLLQDIIFINLLLVANISPFLRFSRKLITVHDVYTTYIL